MKKIVKPKHISQEAWDSVDAPPLTRQQLAEMRPAQEVDPELVAAYEQGKIKYPGQRGKQKTPTKVPVNIRLSPDIVTFFKRQGQNWQTRINDVLQDYVAKTR